MEDTSSVALEDEAIAWYDVWSEVLLRPTRKTYLGLLTDPTAHAGRAFIWMVVIGAITAVFSLGVELATGITSPSEADFVRKVLLDMAGSLVGPVLGLAISAGVIHFVAGFMGGDGTFDQLAYCLGAIEAPMMVFGSLVSLIVSFLLLGSFGSLAALSDPNFDPSRLSFPSDALVVLGVLSVLSLLMGFYALVLQVQAVGTVENISAGKALGAILLPGIVLSVLGGCLVGFLIPLLAGMAMGL